MKPIYNVTNRDVIVPLDTSHARAHAIIDETVYALGKQAQLLAVKLWQPSAKVKLHNADIPQTKNGMHGHRH